MTGKLFIKGKMFDAIDTVTVTGENGEELYLLKRDTSGDGHKIALSTAAGVKIADIEQKYFRDLVRILEPEVIMCLGKDTHLGVLDSLGLRKENPIKAKTPGMNRPEQDIAKQHDCVSE